MRSADRDRQRIHLSGLDEFGGLVRVGQQLVVAQCALSAVAVFLLAVAGFQRTQAAQFALDGYADRVGHIHYAASGVDVVFETGGRLAVCHQRAVHHYAGEAGADGLDADCGRCAVILVHHHRNVRIGFHGGVDEMAQKCFPGILARACGALHDDRAVGFIGRFHDRLDLLQIVHVESGEAIAVFRRVIE